MLFLLPLIPIGAYIAAGLSWHGAKALAKKNEVNTAPAGASHH